MSEGEGRGIYRKYEAVRVKIVQQEFRIKKGEKVKYRDIPADLTKICRWAYAVTTVTVKVQCKDVRNID